MKAKRGKRQETKGKRRKAKGKRGEARGKRGEAKGKRGEGAFSRLASHFSPFADGMPQDRYKTLFYALIALYGVLILSTFRQYGITVDEPPQVAYGQAIFDWYFGEGNITDLFEKDKALELYGVLFNLVAYSTSQLLPFDIYDAHHPRQRSRRATRRCNRLQNRHSPGHIIHGVARSGSPFAHAPLLRARF